MSPREPDAALRQFERDAVVACLAMAAIALVWQRGRPDAAAGVIAGGALVAVSYRAIKGGVDLVAGLAETAGRAAGRPVAPAAEQAAEAAPPPASPSDEVRPISRGRRVLLAVRFLGRYALLAVGAYVMLTCFRVHPAGLVAGATAPFLAAVAQVVRASRGPTRRGHS